MILGIRPYPSAQNQKRKKQNFIIAMKIAQIISTYPPYRGGMGMVAKNYARLLGARGNEVKTFTPDYVGTGRGSNMEAGGTAGDESEKSGETIRLKPVLRYGNAGFLPQIFFRLKNFDAAILHYPFFGTAEVVWLARILGLFRGRLIIQYHMDVAGLSLLAWIMSWPSRLILPSLIKRADLVLSSSLDYISESGIKKYYKKYPGKFIELPFGVDLRKFQAGAAVRDNSSVKNILFVGGLDKAHYFKGLGVLLKSISLLKDSNYSLQVVGDGDLRESYEKMAKELGIENKVEFMRSVDSSSLPEIFRRANLFILPSIAKGEAFGLVLVEAMASGVPVIASNLPGVRTVFNDGAEGYLSRPGDSDDLAEKIKLILTNDDLAKKMGEAGRKLAEEKYDWEKIGGRLNDLIAGK